LKHLRRNHEKGGYRNMLPLGLLTTGEKGEVLDIISKAHFGDHQGSRGRDKGRNPEHCRLEDMGLRTGKTVEVLNNKGMGPLLLKMDDARIALGRRMAMKIMVRRKN
jgi:ferrous iron transport protein A